MPSFGRAGDDPLNPGSTQHHWGYSSPRASVGFEHEVTIWIGAHAILVGEQPPIKITGTESSQRLAARVIPVLDREAHSWGRPPDNLFWVPNIKFVIAPGGNLSYQRLLPILQRHSLISAVDYRLEMDRPRHTFEFWTQ
jgi:hypothetical protein